MISFFIRIAGVAMSVVVPGRGNSFSISCLQILDLVWVIISVSGALFIRDGFYLPPDKLAALVLYLGISLLVSLIVFKIFGLHEGLSRYFSTPDVYRIFNAVTMSIVLTAFLVFALNRLENIPRALPFLHWLFLIVALAGTRFLVRHVLAGKKTRPMIDRTNGTKQRNVIVIGANALAELYLRVIEQDDSRSICVVGCLDEKEEFKGRVIRTCKILGRPREIKSIISDFEIHGVTIDKLILAEPLGNLEEEGRKAIDDIRRDGLVELQILSEDLGLTPAHPMPQMVAEREGRLRRTEAADSELPDGRLFSRKNSRIKRSIDIYLSLALIIMLSPVILIVWLIVAIDVGRPVIFWQQRPGWKGNPLRLYKFRTMAQAFNGHGQRLPNDARLSAIGRFLRRSRLDELPQLLNIFVGEMSFVGPRPLLPIDQPDNYHDRLTIRPGVTGWAQINGGNKISAEDKLVLDVWYAENWSIWLDAKIILKTMAVATFGEVINRDAIKLANCHAVGKSYVSGANWDRQNRPASATALLRSENRVAAENQALSDI